MSNDYGLDYDVILINGDSYSAKGGDYKAYGHFLEESLGIPVKNIAWGGSNNQRIVRSTIEEIINLKRQYKKPLLVIGWSFIRRAEVWYYGDNLKVLERIPDREIYTDERAEPRLVTLDFLINENEATLEQKCLFSDLSVVVKPLVDFYTNQFMLAHTLDAMNISYFFFSAANDTDIPPETFHYVSSLQQVKWCHQNKNIYKLNNFCLSNWAKENDAKCNPVTGHLSESGHENFSKFLIDILKETTC